MRCLPGPLIPLGTHTTVNELEVWWGGGEAAVIDLRGTGLATCDGMEVTKFTPRYTIGKKLVKYNPVSPEGIPIMPQVFLPCRTSRITIMGVRRTLSESKIEKYERPKSTRTESRMQLPGRELWW